MRSYGIFKKKPSEWRNQNMVHIVATFDWGGRPDQESSKVILSLQNSYVLIFQDQDSFPLLGKEGKD